MNITVYLGGYGGRGSLVTGETYSDTPVSGLSVGSEVNFRGVKVELVGEDILLNSRNMVITDRSTATVTVEVSGPRRIVGSWSSDDLIAQVDVSKLTQPAFTSLQYTIKFPDGTDTSSLKTGLKI